MIAAEDIKVGTRIRRISDIANTSAYGGFNEYTIVNIKTIRVLGKTVTLVDLKPKPTLPSGWVNAEQIKRYFELV